MILFAGALLLTPGFFTDAVGFALLLPPVRSAVYRYARGRVNVQGFAMGAGPGQQQPQQPRGPQDRVMDGEFEEVSPSKDETQRPSGWTEQ